MYISSTIILELQIATLGIELEFLLNLLPATSYIYQKAVDLQETLKVSVFLFRLGRPSPRMRSSRRQNAFLPEVRLLVVLIVDSSITPCEYVLSDLVAEGKMRFCPKWVAGGKIRFCLKRKTDPANIELWEE